VLPHEGVVVSFLQFSMKGLFVFYSVMGERTCSSLKVVGSTGDVLCSMESLTESFFVPGARLPLTINATHLSMCLGPLSNDPFVLRLCQVFPEFGLTEMDELGPLVMNEKFEVYSDFMKIVFSLHSNAFRSVIKKITSEEAVEVSTK